MGATNSTPTIELPLFVDNDKPTWRGDVNDAMTKIDDEFVARRTADDTATADIADLNTHAIRDDGPASRIDEFTATNVQDIDSATHDALGVVTVLRDRQQMWLEDFAGVATDGVTECAAAIQAALDAANAAGVTLVSKPGRVYVIASTLNIIGNVDFYASTFAYSGTGIALRVGDPVTGVTRAFHRIGRVVNTLQSNGWATVAGSIGVQLVDINKSIIYIKSVTRFEVGLDLLGHARGCAWNEIHPMELVSNKINLRTHADQIVGYTNSNIFIGGSFNHDIANTDGTVTQYLAGTRHVQILAETGNVSDTCTFISCNFEGSLCEFMVESAGKMIDYNDCRWETNNPGPKVWWKTGSFSNIIRNGYRPDLIIVTNDGDETNCVVWPATGDIAKIYVSPLEMVAVAGTPVASTILRHPCFDAVMPGADILAFTSKIPANWHTFDVVCHITSKGGGNGTLAMYARVLFEGVNAVLATPAGGSSVAPSNVPGPNVKYSFKANAVPIVNDVTGTDKLATFNIYGGGGTNTLGISILGVTLIRKS